MTDDDITTMLVCGEYVAILLGTMNDSQNPPNDVLKLTGFTYAGLVRHTLSVPLGSERDEKRLRANLAQLRVLCQVIKVDGLSSRLGVEACVNLQVIPWLAALGRRVVAADFKHPFNWAPQDRAMPGVHKTKKPAWAALLIHVIDRITSLGGLYRLEKCGVQLLDTDFVFIGESVAALCPDPQFLGASIVPSGVLVLDLTYQWCTKDGALQPWVMSFYWQIALGNSDAEKRSLAASQIRTICRRSALKDDTRSPQSALWRAIYTLIDPINAVPSTEAKDVCASTGCSSLQPPTSSCAVCHNAFYCDRECQRRCASPIRTSLWPEPFLTLDGCLT